MTYKQSLKYLESFIDYEKLNNYAYNKAFGLERIKALLVLLGNPQDGLKCIHVAGTKGKGSTCAFIAYILREAGYNVGLYTSPHLSDFRERIRILKPGGNRADIFEGMISKPDLARLVEKIRKVKTDINLTFFEIYTALAFLYFKEKKVDFAILETGLGGRLDATNVIDPAVCVITPVSLEHTQFLGKTLRKIASEKSGIIKNNKIIISAPQGKEALGAIKDKCRSTSAKVYLPKIDKSLRPRLLGSHQLINASVAKAAVEALRLNIKQQTIKQGICNTIWPARCEIVSKTPLIVLDGAQNAASVSALKKSVKENFKYRKLILVLGFSSDKDIKGITRELRGFGDEIILTKSANPRASDPKELTKYFKGRKAHKTSNVKEAKRKACSIAGNKDLILVAGSLFVAGEFRKICTA